MTTRPGTGSRTSSAKLPHTPTTIGTQTLIHPTAVLTGSHRIDIGSRAIVQARATIDSGEGSISIGASVIIAEKANIRCPPASPTATPAEAHISDGVSIETGATVEATSIGEYSIIEVGARVGKGAIIGPYCKVCAGVRINDGEGVEEDTVIWGNRWDQRHIERPDGGLRLGAGRKGMIDGMAEGVRAVWSNK